MITHTTAVIPTTILKAHVCRWLYMSTRIMQTTRPSTRQFAAMLANARIVALA